MRLRDRRSFKKPEIMIIPMIDIMFFLLVFFMLSTLYMVDLKALPINMPTAKHADSQINATFLVTIKEDGTLWLEDKSITEQNLLLQAKAENTKNPRFSMVIRAEKGLAYGKVITFLDSLKAAGITRFGLAVDAEVKN